MGRDKQLAGFVAALIYTRVSSEDQAREGLSLLAQVTTCRQYVAHQDGWAIEREYQDVLSGTKDTRPSYQQLLADARLLRAAGRRVAVVVARLDRFGRRVLERVRCREEFKDLGIPTHSVAEGGEVSDLVANILASVAQEEVRRLAERISDIRRHIVLSGWAYPCKPAFGYRLRDATPAERAQGSPRRVIEADPLTASTVPEVLARVAAGETVRSVARWLSSLPREQRGGRNWSFGTTRQIFESATYCARPAEGVDDLLARPPGHWGPLIDDATWRRAQERISSHAHMPHGASGRYLLTGLIRCPVCGVRMTGRRSVRKSSSRYRCNGYIGGASYPKPGCSCEVPLAAVDAAVLSQVGTMLDTLAHMSRPALESAWQRLAAPATPDQTRRIAGLEQQAQAARRRLADGAALLVDGMLDRDGYEALRDRERATLDAAEAELTRLRSFSVVPVLPPLDVVFDQFGNWRNVLENADTAAKRDVLGLLIDQVVPARVGYGKYEVQITWTPLGQSVLFHYAQAA